MKKQTTNRNWLEILGLGHSRISIRKRFPDAPTILQALTRRLDLEPVFLIKAQLPNN